MTIRKSKETVTSLIDIVVIYIVIGLAGWLTYVQTTMLSVMLRFFVADVAMTIVAYLFSVAKKNSSVYDAFWSVIPFFFLLVWLKESLHSWGFLHYSTAVVISFWSWRLTHNWYRGWGGWNHEDWRYVDFRKAHGKRFEFTNFFGIHLFPTIMVFGGMTCLFYLYDGQKHEFSVWGFAGNLVSLVGVILELLADNALYNYKRDTNRKPGETMRKGIWNLSRNPNYLGEMLFWVGLAIIGISVGAPWWTCLGAVAIVAMFLFASIPMKEKRMSLSRSDFEQYKKEVAMLIPRIF